jgi:hypothetical protein
MSAAQQTTPLRAQPRAGTADRTPWRLWMLAALLGLQLADAALTRLALSLGALEINPLMRPVFSGPAGLVEIVKVAGVAVIAWLVLRSPDRRADRTLRAGVAVYMGIVVWNLLQIAARA